MKRLVAVVCGVIVFGWMAVAGAYFLAENPGALGFLAEPLRQWLRVPLADGLPPHNLLRVFGHIRASLGLRSFQGLPLEILGALAASVWLFIVFVGTGLRITRGLGLRHLGPLEALAVGGALGFGTWGLFVLLLGFVQLLHPAVLIAVLIPATVVVAPVLRRWVGDCANNIARRPRGAIEWTATVLAFLALAIGLIYTLTPAIQSDGLRYHLSAPQVYLRQHRIVYLPFNAFTNFPFLIEMLFTLSLAVSGDLAAKMIHFECFLLCGLFVALLAPMLFDGLKTEVEPEHGAAALSQSKPRLSLLAALVFWTTPTALVVGAWEFIDLGTALFFIAMVYALVRWHGGMDIPSMKNYGQDAHAATDSMTGCRPVLRKPWRWIAALFLGFLIGTKYTMLAMLAVVPLAILLELPAFALGQRSAVGNQPPAMRNRKPEVENRKWDWGYWLRGSVFIGVVGMAVASPWFVKNVVFTHNPVYPLAWGVFGGGEWNAENARFYLDKSSQKGFHPRYDRNIGETLRHMSVTPWKASIHWPRYEAQFLGPLFLLWIPLLFRVLMDIRRGTSRAGPLRLVILFGFAYGAVWYFTYQSNRLLIPALALLSALVAYSLAVAERTARWLSRGAMAVLLAVCLYNIEWSAEWVFRETSFKPSAASYWLGRQSHDDYTSQAFPPYRLFQLMTEHVRPAEKILFVGEYRTCYCPFDWQASDWFDTPLILHYIRNTPNNETLFDRLLAERTRWVFLNDDELSKYDTRAPEDFFRLRFSDDEWKRFTGILRLERGPDGGATIVAHPRLQPVLQQSGMYLYEIAPKR